jgi:hypothetical protein
LYCFRYLVCRGIEIRVERISVVAAGCVLPVPAYDRQSAINVRFLKQPRRSHLFGGQAFGEDIQFLVGGAGANGRPVDPEEVQMLPAVQGIRRDLESDNRLESASRPKTTSPLDTRSRQCYFSSMMLINPQEPRP